MVTGNLYAGCVIAQCAMDESMTNMSMWLHGPMFDFQIGGDVSFPIFIVFVLDLCCRKIVTRD